MGQCCQRAEVMCCRAGVLSVPLLLQAASREVERDFDSVYSRLVLCKTYRSVPCSSVLIKLLLLCTLARLMVCPILLWVWCQLAAVPVLTWSWQRILSPPLALVFLGLYLALSWLRGHL